MEILKENIPDDWEPVTDSKEGFWKHISMSPEEILEERCISWYNSLDTNRKNELIMLMRARRFRRSFQPAFKKRYNNGQR